jgi:NADPH-dependent glutamate synthase beta subunit-like oxidoreductase
MRSNIKTPTGKYETNVPNVFAAGDARRGQSLVVWAIAEGRKVAVEVDTRLMQDTRLPSAGSIKERQWTTSQITA